MTRDECPTCGSYRGEVRLGVRMSPLKARLFDAIKRAGRDGITPGDLYALATSDRDMRRKTLVVHVWQINEALAETDMRIIRVGGAYVLTRVP